MTETNSLRPPELLSDGGPLIQMRSIRKIFKTAAGSVEVLKNIDADFAQGEFVSVIGRSGSGKSTLVNMLTGIDHPSSGTVSVAGMQLYQMNESEMSLWRGKNLGIVFQFFQLLPMLTLVENVMLPMDFCGLVPAAEREGRALKLLARVGLEDLAHKLPGAISGGQQQSAAVARALANDPPIIVADEPTGNLDSRTAEEIIQLFEELVGQNKTIIMVTHDPALTSRTTRSLIISDGEVIHSAVAGAFPGLPHSRLLKITHLARTRLIQAGEEIAAADCSDGRYYVVSKGSVVVRPEQVHKKHPAEAVLLSVGQSFDAEFMQKQWGAHSTASAQGAVEVLEFEKASLLALLTPPQPAAQLKKAERKGA